ncbi:MAG: helix-turn-helix domain-containing protein [Verrucomicrobiota bacterium]|nr:helix-turn-helix domain-containing protein [Verrucomicrobiota bacterium]
MKKFFDFSIIRKLRKREEMSIATLSERSGVSTAVISKLERNQSVGELETLHRLARVFGMNLSELLALVESTSAHKVLETRHNSNGIHFREISYGNLRCLLGKGKTGAETSKPLIHCNDYELCWVIEGKLDFSLPGEKHELSAGDAIQFDAILEHTYTIRKDCTFLLIHILKERRF